MATLIDTPLRSATGLAESVAETVPVRFLVADVNPAAEGFYVKHDFVPNAAEDAQRKNAATGTVGMRLDLLETVPACLICALIDTYTRPQYASPGAREQVRAALAWRR